MAGHKITTDLELEAAFKLVRRVARDLDFRVDPGEDEYSLTAQKGNFALSIVVGALVAYCYFQISVEERKGRTAIFLERNSPWWTGMIGVGRVKGQAKKLAEAIAEAIEDKGGRVLDEKET
jgi:phytoene dehydrogenase-like protein